MHTISERLLMKTHENPKDLALQPAVDFSVIKFTIFIYESIARD
jgi:hypothetical protein